MTPDILQWAIRHRVSTDALYELQGIFRLYDHDPIPPAAVGKSEAYVQSQVRLEASRKGVKLWRNNVGVLTNTETGQPVRYGLANDSKQLNAAIKSGDLIGWRSVVVTPQMVGTTIAQFVSRECKRPDWFYKGDEHERAQLKWAQVVCAAGGDASFVTGEGTL